MDENGSNTQTSNNNSANSKKWLMIAAAVIIIVVAAAAGGYFFLNSNQEAEDGALLESENIGDDQSMIEEDVITEEETMAETDETSYADGSYTAVGTYSYHSGTETIEVTLALESGVVTSSTVVAQAVHPTSIKMQEDFIANYESEVVGKNIDEVELGKVSGSSLTGIGFNAAVEDIKLQAQS